MVEVSISFLLIQILERKVFFFFTCVQSFSSEWDWVCAAYVPSNIQNIMCNIQYSEFGYWYHLVHVIRIRSYLSQRNQNKHLPLYYNCLLVKGYKCVWLKALKIRSYTDLFLIYVNFNLEFHLYIQKSLYIIVKTMNENAKSAARTFIINLNTIMCLLRIGSGSKGLLTIRIHEMKTKDVCFSILSRFKPVLSPHYQLACNIMRVFTIKNFHVATVCSLIEFPICTKTHS